MSDAVEICLAYLGTDAMAFDRLAWWLTEDGADELERLDADDAWDAPLIVAFDEDGTPIELPPDAVQRIKTRLPLSGGRKRRPRDEDEADNLVTELLESGLTGDPMQAKNRRQETRIDMLRLQYADRSKAWPSHVQ